MSKRKLFVVAGVVLVLVLGGASWWFFIRDSGPTDSEKLDKELSEHGSVLTSQNESNHTETIRKAKAYAANTEHDITLRLGLLVVCIQSAHESGDTAAKESCHADAKKLAESVPDETDKAHWLAEIELKYTNTPREGSPEDDKPQ